MIDPTLTRTEVLYKDLIDGERIIDKSGNPWIVREPLNEQGMTELWLADPVTKVKTHHLSRPAGNPVTVLRRVTHAEEVAKLEAEVNAIHDQEPITADQGEANLTEKLEAETDIEVSATEVDQARAATEDAPVVLPAFETMTDLEMRSHLYLLHGVYAQDVQPRVKLIAMHEKAHAEHDAGTLNAKFYPHSHEEKK